MAKNWTVGEAYEALKNGDKSAIADFFLLGIRTALDEKCKDKQAMIICHSTHGEGGSKIIT